MDHSPHPQTLPGTTPPPSKSYLWPIFKKKQCRWIDIDICLELFYNHGGICHCTPITGGIMGALDAPLMPPSDAKVSFFNNLLKNLIVAQVLRKKFWCSVPIPKIKFDPPPQGKNALVFIF